MNASVNAVNDSDVIKIGLLGCGTVGGSLVNLLAERESELMRTTGLRFQIMMIGVRNTSRVDLPADSKIEVTTDTAALVKDDAIDIVIELIGGIEPARDLVLAALNAGKPVITANKELLAESGLELYQTASANGVDVLFEASAAGAIPIVRPLRESLLGEDIKRVMGIVNGTTNYILTQMSDEGQSYADALSQAQQLGYAESDPTADVEGYDAGAKAAIMASLAFGNYVVSSDVIHEGISNVTKEDITFADELGYVIKLLALAEKFDDGKIGVRVFPALVEKKHPLASVRGSYNAVFLEGEASSELMFYGRGAGGLPTASAVLGDLVDAALNLKRGMHRPVIHGETAVIKPASQMRSSFFFVIDAKNSPGVLSAIAGYFSDQNISIKAMEQEPLAGDDTHARMVFLTEEALDENAEAVIKLCESSDYVEQVRSFFRVLR